MERLGCWWAQAVEPGLWFIDVWEIYSTSEWKEWCISLLSLIISRQTRWTTLCPPLLWWIQELARTYSSWVEWWNIQSNLCFFLLPLNRTSFFLLEMQKTLLLTHHLLKSQHLWQQTVHIMNGIWIDLASSLTSQESCLSYVQYRVILNQTNCGRSISVLF